MFVFPYQSSSAFPLFQRYVNRQVKRQVNSQVNRQVNRRVNRQVNRHSASVIRRSSFREPRLPIYCHPLFIPDCMHPVSRKYNSSTIWVFVTAPF